MTLVSSESLSLDLEWPPESPERRRWPAEEKLAMVRESVEPGKAVSTVARQHGINLKLLFGWR